MMDDFGNSVTIQSIRSHYAHMLWSQIYFYYGADYKCDPHVIASDNPV